MTDPDQPDLGVRALAQNTLGCRVIIRVHLPRARFDVDGDKLPLIGRFYQRPNVAVVNLATPPGELFFTVARLSHCHGPSPHGKGGSSIPCSIIRSLITAA